MVSDEELLARHVAGDTAAFRELFSRHAPRLAGLFRKGVRNEDDVQDLVQQTFLQLHRARADVRPDKPVAPYLYTIALNLRRRHFRDRGRRPTPVELDREPEGHESAIGNSLDRVERAERLREALAQLSPSQREVIELHWLSGMPFSQVAQAVGASLSAVKVRAHRGYKRLKELLEGM